MKVTLTIQNKNYKINFSKPLDISIPLQTSSKNPEAWYLEKPKITPVEIDGWIGSVLQGSAVNFNTIVFNPHAHGTHTECVGHITKEFHSINQNLTKFFFISEVISVAPTKKGKDSMITKSQIEKALYGKTPEALIIRTLPNTTKKKSQKYSHTNWPYLEKKAAIFIREQGIHHLLIDLPSIDKEKDNGELLAHKAFWNYPEDIRLTATITEFIYVSNKIKDGCYLLNLQTAPFVNDATPSRPVLFKIV